MNEYEKLRTEIEARMVTTSDSLAELTRKAEARQANLPADEIRETLPASDADMLQRVREKHQRVAEKFEEFKQADSSSWDSLKHQFDSYMQDFDEELRQAIAYFS